MAWIQCEFFAHSIEKMSSLMVLMPEGMGRGPFPVLYLLHGLSDNHTCWQRRTSLERYVGGRPLIVVTPDAHRSFYVNGPEGSAALAYEDHIVKDVVGFVDDTFPTRRGRAGRALAGLSMGGYGSLMLALRHPGQFCCASSLSGALYFGHARRGNDHPELMEPLGVALRGGPYDIFDRAEAVVGQKNRPALRADCGRQDFLIKHNRLFRSHCKKIGYPLIYKEYPGEHNWDYWDAHLLESIDFVAEHLAMPKGK